MTEPTEAVQSNEDNTISYTQFSIWSECPYRWKLLYIEGKRRKIESIHTIFGHAMHEVLQEYLTVMYKQTIPIADAMDLPKLLFERMKVNFEHAREINAEMSITKEDMVEFFEDGVEILTWFQRNKSEYFPKKGFELVGVEVPICHPIGEGIVMQGYLDVVIRDTVLKRILIYDFKTSHQGWNKYQKADKMKLAQLLVYKIFYATQYDVDPRSVDVQFLVLKRKLFEHSEFVQKRVQKVTPASGTVSTNAMLLELKTFVQSCFTLEGEYKTDAVYEKRPSTKTCKYCEFLQMPSECDRNHPKRALKILEEMKAQHGGPRP